MGKAKDKSEPKKDKLAQGDVVVCVDDSVPGKKNLTEGQHYQIVRVADGNVWVTDDSGNESRWHSSRFTGDFVAGGTVMCVNDGLLGAVHVTEGRQYTILDLRGDDVKIVDDQGTETWWGTKRFESVD